MGRRPVASFPVEFFDMWQLALKGKLYLEFPTKKMAMNKRMQMNQFRKQLLSEDPIRGASLYQVDLMVEETQAGLGSLRSYTPAWKHQVREAMKKEGAEPVKLLQEVQETVAEEAESRLSQTLHKHGFSGEGTG